MNIQQLNNQPIVDFLAKEGIHPKTKRGSQWWYISPIRAPERTPSLKVDTRINRWYDHGLGVGGTLFDLALRLYDTQDVREVIRTLEGHFSFQAQQQRLAVRTYNSAAGASSTDGTDDESKVEIRHIQEIGNNPALTAYLDSRGIDLATARRYCKEVYFKIQDRHYFSVGFENQSGGYELSNPLFKCSSSPKDITLIRNGFEWITGLEGFMDFLSFLTIKQGTIDTDFLVLNSNSNLSKSMDILKEYKQANLFLDNDASGIKTTEAILSSGVPAKNFSCLYQDHKDVNDWLLYQLGKPRLERKIKRSLGIR